MTRRIDRRTVIATSLAASFPAPFVLAQAAWPTKPIRIICAYPPGGLTDQYSRAFGDYIAEKTGQQVIVENKSGGGGSVAAVALKQAGGDDNHTIMTTISATLFGNRVMFKSLPYDPEKDFSYLAYISSGHLPIVAHKATGAKTIAEFVDYAKKNKVSAGTYAAGSPAHIFLDNIIKDYGLDVPIVHYRGEAPMWQDMLAGVCQIACGSYQAAQSVLQTGTGVAIAVPTTTRMKKLPDVRTMAEQGLKNPAYSLMSWICFLGHSGMRQDVVERISALMVDGGKSERILRLLDTFGIDESAQGHAALKAIIQRDGPIWIDAVQKLNLKPE
jgi:tripartite-type tricarboxylate transporter receptor subunit TctC